MVGESFVLDVESDELAVHQTLAKFTLNLMHEIFKHKEVANEVHVSTLEQITRELLGRLIDPRINRNPVYKPLCMSVDNCMLKASSLCQAVCFSLFVSSGCMLQTAV